MSGAKALYARAGYVRDGGRVVGETK
jgi:hypothetical protein